MQSLLGYNSNGKCKVLIIIIFQSKQTSAQLEIKDSKDLKYLETT